MNMLKVLRPVVALVSYFCLLTVVSGATISTVAGDGTGDVASLIKPVINGTLATETTAASVQGMVLDAAGNLYYNAYPYILKRDVNSGTISIVAGNGNFGFSGDGGPATEAELRGNGVTGLGFDLSGNLLIADSYNNRVRLINSAGSILTLWGDSSFRGVTDMEYDSGGTLFVVERLAHRIWITPPTGGTTVFAGSDDPNSGAWNGPGGGFLGDGGSATSALLNNPYGLAIDADGNVYFSDMGNHVIRRIDRTTGAISSYAGTGTVSGFSGDGGVATDALLSSPAGIDFDSSGNLFIADSGNFRVRRVDAVTGVISTVAGSGVYGFSGDGGDALNATLGVSNVALDAADNLFIADRHRVRKVAHADTTPPVGTVSINGGAEYGTSIVALTLTCDDGAGSGCARVWISGGQGVSQWIPFSETLTFYLDPVEGEHTVTVLFEDADRNISEASSDRIIVDLTKPPLPTVTTPARDRVVVVGSSSFTVAGTSEPFATLLIKRDNESGALLATTSADASGNWSATVGPFEDGQVNVSVIAVDRAGNTYGVGMPAGAYVDTTPPAVPLISSPTDGTTTTGTTMTLGGTYSRTDLEILLGTQITITLRDGDAVVASSTFPSINWSFSLESLGVGVHQFSVTATDDVDNVSAASDVVTVTIEGPDVTAPVVTPPTDVTVSASGSFGVYTNRSDVAAFLSGATASDNLDGVVPVTHDAPNQIPLGTSTITFSAVDAAGNIGSATATISVVDQVAPQFISVPMDITVAANSQGEYSTGFMLFERAIASDAVDGSMTVANGKVLVSVSDVLTLGTTTVTYSATDAAGNSAVATSTITVTDQRPPIFSRISESFTAMATSEAGIPLAEVVNISRYVRAVDEIEGEVPFTHDGPEMLPVGTTTVTFRASDSAGNVGTTEWQFTVIALDTSAPVVTAPADIVIAAVDSAGVSRDAVAEFLAAASAMDTEDGTVAVAHDAANQLPIGKTVVTFSATDSAGNTGTATSTVTVADQQAPVLDVPNGLVMVGDTVLGGVDRSHAQVQTFLSQATAQDDIDSAPSVTNDAPSLLPFGVTTITFSVTDEAGNRTTAEATVNINNPDLTGDNAPAPSGTGLTVGQSIALGLDPNAATTDVDGDGIEDSLEVGDPLNPSDADGDGVLDLFESGAAASDASLVDGLNTLTGRVDLQSSGQRLSQVTSSATGTSAPSGVSFPFGVISYETTVATAGGSQTVRLSFSEPLPPGLVLYKVDVAGVYRVIPTSQWRQVDTITVDLTLTDGGVFDLDGVANGVIVDSVALGSNPPVVPARNSGGGGGSASFWVLWLLLGALCRRLRRAEQ